MRKLLVITVILLTALGLYYWLADGKNSLEADYMARYENEELGYSFLYRTAPDGYVIQEIDGTANYDDLIEGLVITLEEDHKSLLSGEREGGEGPPTINIFVFRNTDSASLSNWIERHPSITNIPLRTSDFNQSTVAGQSAIEFEVDGLYPARNVAFLHNDLVYFISGSYLTRDSALYRDFPMLVASFEL
jgi:hypothetical protein